MSLIAALDVHNGQVLGHIIERNDSATFTSFLAEIDQAIHPDRPIHLILDNGSSHRSKATTAWLAAHPRFTVSYTPAHASWLNQVELFFSIHPPAAAPRRVHLPRRPHRQDHPQLHRGLRPRTAKPFRWTYDGSPPSKQHDQTPQDLRGAALDHSP